MRSKRLGVRGADETEKGVERADVFICCLTDDYFKSDRCKQELDFAMENGKMIIPLLLGAWHSFVLSKKHRSLPSVCDVLIWATCLWTDGYSQSDPSWPPACEAVRSSDEVCHILLDSSVHVRPFPGPRADSPWQTQHDGGDLEGQVSPPLG